jgi:hypothetical protein
MLRGLVLLLALANIGFYAWSHGWFAAVGLQPHSQREPERLQRQVAPDAVQLVPRM